MIHNQYTLGLGLSPHDRSYALTLNGQVIRAVEVERLNRIKHCQWYDPKQYTLGRDAHYFDDHFLMTPAAVLDKELKLAIDYLTHGLDVAPAQVRTIFGSSLLQTTLSDTSFIGIPHHLAHAAHAYLSSPYTDAAILVIDGCGDMRGDGYETVSLFVGEGSEISRLKVVNGTINYVTNTIIALSNSIGVLYQNASAIAGFGPFGVGKLMGLASYGKPHDASQLHTYLTFSHDTVEIDNLGLYRYFKQLVTGTSSFQRRADFAASVQVITNELTLFYAQLAFKLTGKKNLCYAGGVAQNAVSNGHIAQRGPFKNIYIPSAPGDNGISIGAALYGDLALRLNQVVNRSVQMPYYGRTYSDSEIQSSFQQYKSKVSIDRCTTTQRITRAAKLISSNRVICWYQGGSEFGPRALGHRSIFANPIDPKMRDRINAIKHREWFRPVAPILLESEFGGMFIDGATNSDSLSYMLVICDATNDTATGAPSIVHIDQTARVQTVSVEQNPDVYNILNKLQKKTGIGAMINTSFNIGDEPIVETPNEALAAFCRSSADDLFIENYHITKKNKS